MSQEPIPLWLYLIPVAWLIVFPLFWLGIIRLLATVSGWQRLAQRFPQRAPFTGEAQRGVSARMRSVNYKGVLTLGPAVDGLHLSTMWLFSFGHPPLFVPWREIQARRTRVWFIDVVELGLGRDQPVPLQLRARTAMELASACHGALRLPERPA